MVRHAFTVAAAAGLVACGSSPSTSTEDLTSSTSAAVVDRAKVRACVDVFKTALGAAQAPQDYQTAAAAFRACLDVAIPQPSSASQGLNVAAAVSPEAAACVGTFKQALAAAQGPQDYEAAATALSDCLKAALPPPPPAPAQPPVDLAQIQACLEAFGTAVEAAQQADQYRAAAESLRTCLRAALP